MEQSLRMYTEEQVAEMLQVSLSQLRKWRMKQHEGQRQGGPPFRKIGRLVRYPEAALRVYINSEQTDPAYDQALL
jgi:transposase-like protein